MKKTDTKFPSGILLKTFLFSLLFYFLIGFNFQDSRTGGWIRQYITAPIGGAQIYGIDFKDSLTGYAIANVIGTTDTSYVLKTTNGGFNWNIILNNLINARMYSFKMLNKDTLFVGAYFHIYRTYNGGLNWTIINIPGPFVYGINVLNTDTMWYACPTPNGLYRTTNGGLSWQQQMYYIPGVNGYPQSIYMYNRNMGFVGTDNGELLKTTNSGVNWSLISGVPNFSDMFFKDSLTGFMASSGIYKTTNGGLDWQFQILPLVPGVLYSNNIIKRFSYKNDTIFSVFSYVIYPNFQSRAVIYKTTNGGINWGYQIPDTGLVIQSLHFSKFITGLYGWCYSVIRYGIITLTGGDSTIYTGINNNISTVSKEFILHQNYPNPFNSTTLIGYYIQEPGWVKIKIYDITGKEMSTLVNEVQGVGGYGVPISFELPSGVYFYKMILTTKNGIQMDTKKMVVVK
jgi:hypothetical protein